MVATLSSMLPLGHKAEEFALPNYNGNYSQNTVRLSDLAQSAVLIMFICNHCPYVLHIMPKLRSIAQQAIEQGVEVIAINSNDVEQYPADSPDKMREFAQQYQLPFAYCFDASQEIARKYQATCTPDFFLFDTQHTLQYRGQFDASRPGNDIAPSGSDVQNAIFALLNKQPMPAPQVPSLGCNIKWKEK